MFEGREVDRLRFVRDCTCKNTHFVYILYSIALDSIKHPDIESIHVTRQRGREGGREGGREESIESTDVATALESPYLCDLSVENNLRIMGKNERNRRSVVRNAE